MKRTLWLVLSLALAVPAGAQVGDTTQLPTGVRLGLIYTPGMAQRLAVRPFEADGPGAVVASQATDIVTRDLDYSDRFDIVAPTAALAEAPITYGPWNDLGVAYLVSGTVRPDGDGWSLRIVLHDVTYASVLEQWSFRVPAPADDGFRMTVHAASDAIVERVTGQRGMAASSIAFIRRMSGRYELMLVDYDGENLRRVSSSDDILLSPAWSSDGSRLAYSVVTDEGRYQVQERRIATGDVRVLVDRPGLNITPSYSPGGELVAFAIGAGAGTDIYSYDVRRDCCLTRVEGGRGQQLSPTYSPDGRRMAFNSDRLGQPHIYVIPATGGQPELISPFVYGEPGYYTSPDWSPTGSLVAFHGRSRGNFQIMVADADAPSQLVRQVTADGVSEDPSWAPDGRHLVFSGWRDSGRGLYVIDSSTGRLRPVVIGGGDLLVPDWSPTLMRASDLALDGR